MRAAVHKTLYCTLALYLFGGFLWSGKALMRHVLIAAVVAVILTKSGLSAALETTGRVATINLETDIITLENGSSFVAPADAVLLSVSPGLCVTIDYDMVDGKNLIGEIRQSSAPLGDPAKFGLQKECPGSALTAPSFPETRSGPDAAKPRMKFRDRPLSGQPTGKIIQQSPD